MRSMRFAAVVLIALLAGCGGAPAVPDFTYFRLPRAQPIEPSGVASFRDTIVVEPFSADGLYADQALVYALGADAQQLRQYHYQLWTDPPTRFLQRRLIAQLRAARTAMVVTDELPASKPALRIRGVILRFDRVPDATGGFAAVVALKLRADAADGTPLVDDYYRAQVPAAGATLKATVAAYASALDTIFAKFHADLLGHAGAAHAG